MQMSEQIFRKLLHHMLPFNMLENKKMRATQRRLLHYLLILIFLVIFKQQNILE